MNIRYALIWVLYTRILHPLKDVPGPFWSSVTRLSMVYRISQGDMDTVQRRLHKQHGPLIRIAPDEVACANPEVIRKTYRTRSPLAKTNFCPVCGTKLSRSIQITSAKQTRYCTAPVDASSITYTACPFRHWSDISTRAVTSLYGDWTNLRLVVRW